jgi:hypothetical protein
VVSGQGRPPHGRRAVPSPLRAKIASLKRNKRGPGGPHYSRPGGQRYSIMPRGSTMPVDDSPQRAKIARWGPRVDGDHGKAKDRTPSFMVHSRVGHAANLDSSGFVPPTVQKNNRSLSHSLPGPQKRGTGGTLIVVGIAPGDRGHPPMSSGFWGTICAL